MAGVSSVWVLTALLLSSLPMHKEPEIRGVNGSMKRESHTCLFPFPAFLFLRSKKVGLFQSHNSKSDSSTK